MGLLTGQKVLIGVTGSIAAYKAAELVRLIRKEQGKVRVVLTEAAARFVSPATFETLSGQPALLSLFEDPLAHVELARWADKIAIVPATADFLAKMRSGVADDLLSTLVLASDSPILVAPAMNQQMWQAAATQENVKVLRERHVVVLGPDFGEQACGEVGFGRMVDPQEILFWLPLDWSDVLEGVHVVITAGPTREPLDPVRFISNRSSGKMGYALARAAKARGAEVTLISGPTALLPPWGTKAVRIEQAEEMEAAVLNRLGRCDIFIGAAAVADYRPAESCQEKFKKSEHQWQIKLLPNPDIIQTVAKAPSRPKLVVGFAAETENLLENARGKLSKKNLDAIVANSVAEGQAFEQDENEVWWVTAEGENHLPKRPKVLLADRLMALITELYCRPCRTSN